MLLVSFSFFFLVGICVFWMDAGKPISWLLHSLACQWTTVHFGDGKISTSQKPCRDSERHIHHIRYTTFYMSIYFVFMGGEGWIYLRFNMGKTPSVFKLPSFQGTTQNIWHSPDIQQLSFKTCYWWTTVLITTWENTSIFYCIFQIHLVFLFFKYINYLSSASSFSWPHLPCLIGFPVLGDHFLSPLLDDCHSQTTPFKNTHTRHTENT